MKHWLLMLATFLSMSLVVSPLFAVAAMFIILSHELGHYVMCRVYGIAATYPFFIPLPLPGSLGTLGAVIRIKEPFPHRRALFDIGVAGPIAGFVATLLVLLVDIFVLGKPELMFPEAGQTYLVMAEPLFMRIAHVLAYGRPLSEFHMASGLTQAAWLGFLLTALNLIPAGQLDGGHILYAVLEERAPMVGRLIVFGLVFMGVFVWSGWTVWALFLLLTGLRHPPFGIRQRGLDGQVYLRTYRDLHSLDPTRLRVALVALIIFLGSVLPIPLEIKEGKEHDSPVIRAALEAPYQTVSADESSPSNAPL